MKCDVCQAEDATVYFSQLIEGKLKKVNLCKGCAEEKGVTDPTGFALADMLQGMGQETVTEKRTTPGDRVCDECGFTQSDFKKTGRFGCAHCYEVFSEGLENLLEAMHKNTEHKGKVPKRYEATKAHRERLNELKEQLQEAVASEDYEEAARLRDAISKTEAEEASSAPAGDD
ncbi:MAG: UvrB/UvrC motif-containing protein [Verrucomicrobiae bacterium]|nr:UvrB/UvrC motif-containing protein [Verrucomicrobiae bacterium]